MATKGIGFDQHYRRVGILSHALAGSGDDGALAGPSQHDPTKPQDPTGPKIFDKFLSQVFYWKKQGSQAHEFAEVMAQWLQGGQGAPAFPQEVRENTKTKN